MAPIVLKVVIVKAGVTKAIQVCIIIYSRYHYATVANRHTAIHVMYIYT